jgi:hypothetical protein
VPLKAGAIVYRALLYLSLALAFLSVSTLLIVLRVRTGITFSGAWIALVVWTAVIFWVVVRSDREYWGFSSYWLAVLSLFVTHSAGFVAILHGYPQWRPLWFIPVAMAEAALFSIVLDVIFKPKHRRLGHFRDPKSGG